MTGRDAATTVCHHHGMFSGKIFRSRWAALLWAGGVIWTAYDVAEASAPPAKADQTKMVTHGDAASSDPNLAILSQFANGN